MAQGKLLTWIGEENQSIKVFSNPNVSTERVKQVIEETITESLYEEFTLVSEETISPHIHHFEYEGEFGSAEFILETVDIE